MNIVRFFNRLNFIESADQKLTQVKLYRYICGGIYVKMAGVWYGASAVMTLGDKSRILRLDGQTESFHETYNGIESLEEHC